MSISMRDTRVRLYSYSDAGSGGDILPTYTFVEERWGRVEAPSGRASAVAGQQENTIDAVIALPRGAQASRNGLAKVGTQYYKITALLDRRLANETQLLTVFADDATFTIVDSAAPVVASVEISPLTLSLAVNATQQFTATPKDSGGNPITGRAVQWFVGDPAKASITQGGLFTALASGTVDVLAVVDGVVGTAVVTVGLAPGVQKVTVSPTSGTVPAYGALSFAVAPLDASGNIVQGRTVVAVSSDPTVATVSVAGYVVTVTNLVTQGTGPGADANITLTVTVDSIAAPVAVLVQADPLGTGNTPLLGQLTTLGIPAPGGFWDLRKGATVIAGPKLQSVADCRGASGFGPLVDGTGTEPDFDATNFLASNSTSAQGMASAVSALLRLSPSGALIIVGSVPNVSAQGVYTMLDQAQTAGWIVNTTAGKIRALLYQASQIAATTVAADASTVRCMILTVDASANYRLWVPPGAAVGRVVLAPSAANVALALFANGVLNPGTTQLGAKFAAALHFPSDLGMGASFTPTPAMQAIATWAATYRGAVLT
jgi:hypothetical protein